MRADQLQPEPARLRSFLAAALRGEPAGWPGNRAASGWAQALPQALAYHGIAGLLVDESGRMAGWPKSVVQAVQVQARAEAMWELKHRDLLCRLLEALEAVGVRPLVMKGSALACDIYPRPAARPRGDSDLLVEPRDVPAARRVLEDLGYRPFAAGRGLEWLQQGWTLACSDGSRHAIDLHWAVLNAPALSRILPVSECFAHARPLPALCPQAQTMDPARTMVHLCLHRALHITAPYMVGDEAHFGGDRLIWSYDIHLLAARLDRSEWSDIVGLAVERRVAGACLNALEAARADLGAPVPDPVLTALREASPGDLSYFARSRAIGRAWEDFRAMPGVGGKLSYLASRLLPEPAFLRTKYPDMARLPLPLLYLRRIRDALRDRAGAGNP